MLTLVPLFSLTVASAKIWPDRLSINKQFEVLQEAGCSGFCALNGFGDGLVIGTAPICEATCSNACPGRACISPIPGRVPHGDKSFMPDAGGICWNMAVEAANITFAKESLLQKFQDVLMMKGKACCCQTLLPMETSVTKHEPTPPGSTSCDDWCQGGGYGHGIDIGTSPTCGASCESDCAGNVCSISNNFFSDHGAGCVTGDKVCCCAAKNKWPGAADLWKKVKDKFAPPARLPTPFSCSDYCQSGGWGNGHVIGTAPSCAASCSSDCAGRKCVTVSHGDVTDSGQGCWSGDKVCCCDKGDETLAIEI